MFAKLKQELQCETLHLVLRVVRTQLLVWGECAFCSPVGKRWIHVPTLDFMETKAAVGCVVQERASVPGKSFISMICCVTGDVLDPLDGSRSVSVRAMQGSLDFLVSLAVLETSPSFQK